MLDKKNTMWDRDKDNKLIPQEFEFEYERNGQIAKESFLSIILTRVELANVLTGKAPDGSETKDADGSVILHCVKNPAYATEEVGFLKKEFCIPMVTKILKESGAKFSTDEDLKKKVNTLMNTETK